MKILEMIVIVVLVTILVGGGVYFWQKIEQDKIRKENERKIENLQNQITDLEQQLKTAKPKDKKSCESLGGKWGKFGLNPQEVCNLPTTDPGKSCSDSSQCEGLCIADEGTKEGQKIKGQCSEWKITVGCVSEIKNGEVQKICYD